MHYFSYDGEATMWCYERLKKSRANRRIMFVVTDGDPSGTYLSKKGDSPFVLALLRESYEHT